MLMNTAIGSGEGTRTPYGETMRSNSASSSAGIGAMMGNLTHEKEANIQVVVRCRGLMEKERKERQQSIVEVPLIAGKEVLFKGNNKSYRFDKVYGPEADQELLYKEIAQPILKEVLQGYNCTILAYGQTGTGKTYTMEGDITKETSKRSGENLASNTIVEKYKTEAEPLKREAGIIPRILQKMFGILDNSTSEYSVKISYLELYNEELRDLLTKYDGEDGNGGPGNNLKLYDDGAGKGGVIIQGLEEILVRSPKDAVRLLEMGSQRRIVGATRCNEKSSRSHSIFTITVHIKERMADKAEDELLKIGKLNLVDLAGSENIGRSGAELRRAREAGMINQSLLTLGRVINALVEKQQHIPYRESKLTRLLKDSLGGRTKTSLIATINPLRQSMDETLSTLEYANRAKCIRNRPEVNKKIARTVLVSELQAQIEKLQADMTSTILKNGVYLAPERYQELVELEKYKNGAVDEWKKKVDLREDELKEAHKQLEGLNDKMDRYVEQEREYKQRLVKQQEEIQRTKTELQGTKVRLVQQKYISKARGRGEEKLVEAAERLMQIVSKSNNSITGLLEVVDKSTELGAQNLEALEDYSVKIQQQHKSLVNKLGSGAAEFSKSLGGVASGLTVEMQRVFGDDFKADFERLVQEYQSLVASEAQKCALIMERETQKIRSDMDEFKARYIDARESIGSNIQKLSQESSEVLEKIYRNIQESRDKATKLFGEMSDHSESFMTQTYEGLQECKTNMQKYNDVYESTTNENNRDIELQIAELQKERENAKEQLLLDYEKIMNEMKLRFEQALKTQNTKWAKVITDLHTINETNKQKSLEIDRHRHQLAENLDTLCQTSHTLGEQLSTNNQQGLSSLGSDFDFLSTSVSQLNSTLKHSTKAVGLAVEKQLDAIEPQPMVGQINERLESKEKGVSIATSAIESHVSSVFTKVESSLMEKERDKLSQTTKVFADNLSNTAGQITTELGSLVSEVNKTVQPTISDCISGSMNRSKILLEHNQRIKRQKIAHNIGWEVSVPEKIITERITCVVDDNNSGVNSGEADDSWLTIPVLGSIESVMVDGLDTKAKLNTSFSQPSTVQAADTPRKKLRENGALVNALKRKLELQNQQDARNNNNEAEIGVGVESESESFNDNHNDTVLGSDEDFRNSAVSTPSALPIPLSLNTNSSAIANSDSISNNVTSDSTSSFGFKRKNSNLVLNNSIGNADKNRFSRGFFHNTNR